MKVEAVKAGYYESLGKHPKCQILTIRELLSGAGIDYPASIAATLKRSPKVEKDGPENADLFAARARLTRKGR
jgi:hypothetical protein